ncbi:alpha-amylase family protein [Cellulomonas sp. WB94]|uniref:alpha-amylase n=1 Tax=Cellulomonas sp. WB94 TaxID=2173174 RepID=UPI001F5B76AE|nr:alpha-amylase family protein [Cellulomonas sp. WB94]
MSAACTTGVPAPAATSAPTGPAAVAAPAGARDVGVQLFQWTWDAIAAECTDHLGPAGYGWVLTSPPQEHVLGSQWWTAYQPVSYRLESRLGTRAQLSAMVAACHAAGVEVLADAVVNHMTGKDARGTGWAGSPYSHYDYPGIWSDAAGDFHHCGVGPADDISSYKDAFQVQSCELVNLADLATGTGRVQDGIAAYLTDLLSLGVDGFRIDAAKHLPAEDLAAIVARLPAGTRIVSEVIRGTGEPVTPEQYTAIGDVLEFGWGKDVTGMVRGGSLRLAAGLGTGSTYLPSDKAWIFVENHDTERSRSTLGYRDGADYVLANVLMLATDYGRPIVYSGYAFTDRDAGPVQDAAGKVLDAQCAAPVGPDVTYTDGEWVCQHRWTAIEGMVGWRDAVGDDPVGDRWEDGDAFALSRGTRGLVVLNGGDVEVAAQVPTTLSDGSYCDVVAGPAVDGRCAGDPVAVRDGVADVRVAPHTAVALHVGAPAGA